MGFYKEIAIQELNKEQIPKCDCCNEDADFSDYGINLCTDCKRDNCEGLGHLYDAFVRKIEREDQEFYACTGWTTSDIMEQAEEEGITMTKEEAREFLHDHGEGIVESMVQAGWTVIEHTLSQWKARRREAGE